MKKFIDHKIKYQRVIIKISGEVLKGSNAFGINITILKRILKEIKYLLDIGVEIVIVIGGGNFFRGKELQKIGISKVISDQIGILSTMINGLAIKDVIEQMSVKTCLMSAIGLKSIFKTYDVYQAINSLSKQYIVICSGGMGHACFTTDSAACLRAIELKADIVLKGTKVDGIYSTDPIKFHDAILYPKLKYKEVLDEEFQVMDINAFILARDYNIPICIFNITKPGSLYKIIIGKNEGTLVHG